MFESNIPRTPRERVWRAVLSFILSAGLLALGVVLLIDGDLLGLTGLAGAIVCTILGIVIIVRRNEPN